MWRFLQYAKRRNQGFTPAASISLSEGARPADTVVGLVLVFCFFWLCLDFITEGTLVEMVVNLLHPTPVWRPY